jgi:septal ring factor EnvC (AmiA/AmiB activator)
VADDAGGDGDAGPSDAGTSGGGGGGDGPVTKELARLREESERLARELGAVRDALDEVRERQKNGDAPVDAALQIAVGERRVQGLTDKRDALAAKIDDVEANVAAEASERPSAAPAPPPPASHRRAATATRKSPAPRALLADPPHRPSPSSKRTTTSTR